MDEIFHDLADTRLRLRGDDGSGELARHHQRWGSSTGWLVKIAADQRLQDALKHGAGAMPESTLLHIIEEHDLQSVLLRHREGVTCDATVAEALVGLCKDVYSWSCWSDAPKMYADPKENCVAASSSQPSSPPLVDMQSGHTSGMDSDSDDSDI
jgi:hypothetical protein